jgi:hypothetical protein
MIHGENGARFLNERPATFQSISHLAFSKLFVHRIFPQPLPKVQQLLMDEITVCSTMMFF